MRGAPASPVRGARRGAAAALIAQALAGVALAQAAVQPVAPSPVTLQPGSPLRLVDFRPRLVDQGIVDRGGLTSSLYDVGARTDLRHDQSFQRIYETQSRTGQRRFIRYDGALGVSFPVSQYVWSRETKTEVPVYPAGMIWHIGQPGPWSAAPFPAPLSAPEFVSPLKLNGRVDALPELELRPHVEREAERLTMADERYRMRRLRELMRLAAVREAERAASLAR